MSVRCPDRFGGSSSAGEHTQNALPGYFWAKTKPDGSPGIEVFDHCLNVGAVAETIISALPDRVRTLLPEGIGALAALHDIGKITLGFQAKCPAWLQALSGTRVARQASYSVSDHALVSQVFLQEMLRPQSAQLWAAAVGAHHGRPKGRDIRSLDTPEAEREWAQEHRSRVTAEICRIFGPLPTDPPRSEFEPACSDVWLAAGLITMADWIASNEEFFSSDTGLSVEKCHAAARSALQVIGWPGGGLQDISFEQAFGFKPNALQEAVKSAATSPGLYVIEAPMGCGKTEAAMAAVLELCRAGHHHGFYFALPTQVTSNRVHLRLRNFLKNALSDAAHFRLAHGHAWLEPDFSVRLKVAPTPAAADGEERRSELEEIRSWFASSKQALLAPYGVGTVDQALQGMVTVKHFFLRRFALAGKVVVLDEVHSYDLYTGTLIGALVRELLRLGSSVIVLSATLTHARRRELLAMAGCDEDAQPPAYPLVTCGIAGRRVAHVCPGLAQGVKNIGLRCAPVAEQEVIAELTLRARSGQHVLWIRNTVAEAQNSFRMVRAAVREGECATGLLHSRFPYLRRAELENHWLERLGKDRREDQSGSILIATQLVEQSVDIDLDFMVSDVAPIDMLLQRIGRLWRHERSGRRASRPECWVRLPWQEEPRGVDEIRRQLGKSGKVYAPYALLRTMGALGNRTCLALPQDIRALVEATYGDPATTEKQSWVELREELEAEKRQLELNAEAAMLVFGRPMLDPENDGALTRRKGPPTTPIVLLRSVVPKAGGLWDVAGIDGKSIRISATDWDIDAARFLHQRVAALPSWMVPRDAQRPAWLALHTSPATACALLQEDGSLDFNAPSAVVYTPDLGFFSNASFRTAPSQQRIESDDEFDS